MIKRRLVSALCVIAIVAGYAACNRIVDLGPPRGPDANFVDGSGSGVPPDMMIIDDAFDGGSDTLDAS